MIKRFVNRETIFIFIASVMVMIITHGFCFMNIMYSHDNLYFTDVEGLGKVKLGRWLYPFIVHIRLMATPWLMGVFSCIYVSIAVVLVSKVLDFSKKQGLCVAILFATNVTLTSLFCTYVFDADADCLALLLACFAVYAFKKFPEIWNIIVPIVSITLCLALYQAYICVAIGLFILLLVKESINSECWRDIINVLKTGLKELGIIILGVILYIPSMYAMSKVFGVGLSTDYNGAGKLSSLGLVDVIKDIPSAYKYFFESFFKVTGYNRISVVAINWVMLVIIILSVLYIFLVRKKFIGSLVIIIPSLLILPLGLNAIHLVSFGRIHQLMIFAFCLVYLLPLNFLKNTSDSLNDTELQANNLDENNNSIKIILYIIVVAAIAFIGFNNITYSNGAYVYKKLVYDNTSLHAQTIWKDINNIDGYDEGVTQVVFMGDFTNSKASYHGSVENRYLSVLTGANNSAITYQGTYNAFFRSILGRNMKIEKKDESLINNPEYIEMPAYPADGYCRMIGDRVVVKLQE